MTDDSQAERLFMRGSLGPVVAPLTVPCVRCGCERLYAPPAPPERRWWHLWRRDDEGRCPACGAL
jgi:hypothetical protein